MGQIVIRERTWTAWRVETSFYYRLQVFMATAATAANDIDAKLGDKIAQRCRHWLRLHWVDRQPVDVEWDARVRDRRNRERAIVRQEAHRLAHVLRSSRAVEA